MTGLVREIVRIHRIRQNIDHKTSFHAIGHTITTNDSAAHRKHQDVVLIQGFCGLGRPNETAISKARHQKYADQLGASIGCCRMDGVYQFLSGRGGRASTVASLRVCRALKDWPVTDEEWSVRSVAF